LRRAFVVGFLLLVVGGGAALYVLKTTPPWYERARYPLHYGALVREQARQKGLDPALLAAVIYQESRFRSGARSSSGAVGLMQLRPETAKGIALRTGGTAFEVSDLTDPAINIRYGSWYLQHLFTKYDDERLVLAAYNAGQGNVDRWLDEDGEIAFPETRAYVEQVERLKGVYREAWHSALYTAD
jgi:soluble lytic murein transglycosylase